MEWLAKKRAESHSKLDYHETRRENVETFNSILFLLKANNIKPTVIIYPTQKIYSSYFSENRLAEFYEILDEVKLQHDFQLIDMFSSSYFKEKDFSDGDHLNKIGARKMTLYLERNISW
ncbi:D-alanyl-lipoteichoic acid biosynthesis protein DltD [Paenibacillus sp. FSL R5-0887]|uniref:D-alanyl-lipoteichoic acid biosynthesis protein DltD n=1 Tax=Paenibacillus sp. FSL R5-0887 TaxID=2921662 RepID=UPI004046E6A3